MLESPAGLGQASNNTKSDRQEAQMEHLMRRFESNLHELDGVRGQLANMADRVCGAVPPTASSDAVEPSPDSLISAMRSKLNTMENIVATCYSHINRLNENI